MKILVLNGSPKRERSDTLHITRAFLAGMGEAVSTETEIVHVIDEQIGFCRGCFACKRNGGKCPQQDDMAGILQKMLASDVLLFSFPLYCYGMPGPLKNLVDRTMPLSAMTMRRVGDRYEHVGQADYEHLKYVMICGCGFPNAKHNFEPMTLAFRQMFPRNAAILTVPESPMFNVPQAAEVTEPRLEMVRRAGRAYGETGEMPPVLAAQINTPMIPEEIYARMASGEEG